MKEAMASVTVRSDFPKRALPALSDEETSGTAGSGSKLGLDSGDSQYQHREPVNSIASDGSSLEDREARRLMMAAQRVQRGQSLRQEVPLVVNIDWDDSASNVQKSHSQARAHSHKRTPARVFCLPRSVDGEYLSVFCTARCSLF